MFWIHADDGVLVTSNDTIMERLKLMLIKILKLKWDKNINIIVGIEVKRERYGLILKQRGKIKKLIQATDSCITSSQPLHEINLESSPASQSDRNYLLARWMILYLAQTKGQDVMYIMNYLARVSMEAQHNHWKALKHL
ncbi:hypothetical protein O181_056678 [Austropuccinia psidii MF-1]|uniref:Reverse transcriptase domain-containing protein n=1 Tax=Austropuccinia psidii MF-1 TaxID=1389203 RepID=A0A9Q3EA01_9BASI|nr:hypothetical protein [Austropuccinia psidii MF-1]